MLENLPSRRNPMPEIIPDGRVEDRRMGLMKICHCCGQPIKGGFKPPQKPGIPPGIRPPFPGKPPGGQFPRPPIKPPVIFPIKPGFPGIRPPKPPWQNPVVRPTPPMSRWRKLA